MRRIKKSSRSGALPMTIEELIKHLNERTNHSPDLVFSIYEQQDKKVAVFCIAYLVDQEKIEQFILGNILNDDVEWTTANLLNEIPLKSGKRIKDLTKIVSGLIEGIVYIYLENEADVLYYELAKVEKRALEKAETESLVFGPQVAFTESLVSNLNILTWKQNSTDLVMEKFSVGEKTPREVRVVYMNSIANETDIHTMKQRISELKVDTLLEIHDLKQYLHDSQNTLFPLFYTTELVDRSTYALNAGKIVVLVEGSPNVLIAPSTFFSFFETTEDQYIQWPIGSFMLIIRFLAAYLTIVLTPVYVAIITFHYEIIPPDLLISIGKSRANVPFPPILEVLFLELMIELLREAGARLPSKVAQTIGIVGGVVIGTAAVQAGVTSNILIILITISALASFTTPNYIMGAAIRLVRFPLILLAGLYGLIGIMVGICFLCIHLLRLNSLGRPYLSPLYPFQWSDFNKVFFRLPKSWQGNRFKSYQLKDQEYYHKRAAIEKDDKKK